ncbi:MAG: molecular chaperone TorD family protein [Chloroflexota bacterium]|nr:molecular chaperone TorD family protein [Chloroflexota bacterium]
MTSRARARSQLYGALALAFRKPEAADQESEQDSLAQILQQAALAFDAEALGQIAGELVESLKTFYQTEQALRTLEIEYNRLFVGPGRPQVPPYESVYRDARGLVMGPAARDVERQYTTAGLGLAPNHHDLPDHVATELGFMAYLTLQEAEAQDEDATIWLDRERAFLRDHLAVWLPRFCQRVRETSQHPFYSALAELTVTFVNLDMEWIESHYTNSNPRERLDK